MTQATKRVGAMTVTAVSDGILKTGLDCVVGLPPDECAELAGSAYDAPIYLPVNSFLIEHDGKRLLVDTGAGNTMQPTLGQLTENLRGLGIPPEDIDVVLLTHLHSDHANGLTDDAGRAVFPKAEIVLHEQESRFWLEREPQPSDSERLQRNTQMARRMTAPYRGRIRTVGDGEALPGISAELQAGHTPGHTGWLLQSQGERLLIWGDIVHLPEVQVPRPDVALIYDVDPVMAPQTRRRVFERVARENLCVAGAHIGFPGFGRLTQSDRGFAYVPEN
jgi:glyoxylase-like metal-dependent hydrolase (beta-lactamase superfamily II)